MSENVVEEAFKKYLLKNLRLDVKTQYDQITMNLMVEDQVCSSYTHT